MLDKKEEIQQRILSNHSLCGLDQLIKLKNFNNIK